MIIEDGKEEKGGLLNDGRNDVSISFAELKTYRTNTLLDDENIHKPGRCH